MYFNPPITLLWLRRETILTIQRTVRRGYILINRSQQDALFLNFVLDKELYMFRTDLLSIIRSLNTVFTAVGIFYTVYVDSLLERL